MATEMEKPANHAGDVALERVALGQVSAFVPSTSYPARAVAVIPSAGHVIELADCAHHCTRVLLLHRQPAHHVLNLN